MKSAKKTAGFFIVEILVVLLIIGILVTALMPNLTTYTQRAQFVDNLSVAGAIRPAVEGCLIQNPSSNWASNCTPGTTGMSGIPANQTGNLGNFVSSVVVSAGAITVTSASKFGSAASAPYTYTLTPTSLTSGAITWAVSPNSAGGIASCTTAGLC